MDDLISASLKAPFYPRLGLKSIGPANWNDSNTPFGIYQ